jgi:hypothetical protein
MGRDFSKLYRMARPVTDGDSAPGAVCLTPLAFTFCSRRVDAKMPVELSRIRIRLTRELAGHSVIGMYAMGRRLGLSLVVIVGWAAASVAAVEAQFPMECTTALWQITVAQCRPNPEAHILFPTTPQPFTWGTLRTLLGTGVRRESRHLSPGLWGYTPAKFEVNRRFLPTLIPPPKPGKDAQSSLQQRRE